ncbi:Core-2/I-branching beta-1 [Perilla frutescens var. hirtella]|nr:Core-2/I-branching beta-1 [Perilla frutescens var. frutescens]KAH6788028.1 Core-2/I-branching beta-1 [Perilla frutescens var. hirtella]
MDLSACNWRYSFTFLSLSSHPHLVRRCAALHTTPLLLHHLPISDLPPPPSFGYLISRSAGDGSMLHRTLETLYHPSNQSIVHLDAESSADERLDLYNCA